MDDVTFDSPAAVRAMKQRHAELGRRTLAIVDVALREWEAKIAAGEPLDISPQDIKALRDIGEKMSREADGDPPITPKKPN